MIKTFIFLSSLAFFLTGCFSPQEFYAKVSVKENKDIEFSYKGTVIDHQLFSAFQSKKISHKEVEDYENQVIGSINKKEARLKKYDHIDNGLVMVDYVSTENIVKYKTNLINIKNNKDGSYTLTMPLQEGKYRNLYRDTKLDIDGNLEVNLPRSVKVISHNADDAPSMFGNTYKWKYTMKTKQAPSITFSFSS